jgi:hypothetical protein
MRIFVCVLAVAAALGAHPATAQPGETAFWKSVQARCDATAARPPSETGRRVARAALDEFYRFGGHAIDADGRLFHFGQTEAEHEQEHSEKHAVRLGDLGWWRVTEYWRALYGKDFGDKLEVRGYRGAADGTDATQAAKLLRPDLADLLRAAESIADPALREAMREAALRAAIIDTPWSAAFISYVIRQAGVAPEAFLFANAHRTYIYDAFAVSAAENLSKESDGKERARLYRACPLGSTRPRAGDLVCFQREPALVNKSDAAVRETIMRELADNGAHSVRQTHCDTVAFIDAPAKKMYVIGGNVEQAVTVKKLNLRRDMTFSPVQTGHCGGPGRWTLPRPSDAAAAAPNFTENCSLIDKKWFVLLQMR